MGPRDFQNPKPKNKVLLSVFISRCQFWKTLQDNFDRTAKDGQNNQDKISRTGKLCENNRYNRYKTARQAKTTETGHPERVLETDHSRITRDRTGHRDTTTQTRHPGQQPGQNSFHRTPRKLEQDTRDRSLWTGNPGKVSRERKTGTGQSGLTNSYKKGRTFIPLALMV